MPVTFFQSREFAPNQTAQWAFDAPATTGTSTYTYRVVPQAGLSSRCRRPGRRHRHVAAAEVAGTPTRYVVQTIAPDLPDAPSVGVPQLPDIEVPDPTTEAPEVEVPGGDDGGNTGGDPGSPDLPESIDGASVPVFGEPAGPDGSDLAEGSAGEDLAPGTARTGKR